MKFKVATLSDVEAFAPVFHEYRHSSISIDLFSTLADSSQWITDRISGEDAVFFIALQGETIVGFITLYNGFSSVSLKKYLVLNDLYVAESARGLGYARQLMALAHEFAQENGVKGIELETATSNVIAQRLYESLGYVDNNLYKNYFWKTVL